MATAVFFHAHPDDEAIQTGGTMAKMAADGHRVVLVTATRGELGEVPDGFLAPGETLAERRAVELAAACDVLGVARHEYLGYRDSGMAGEPTNDDPDCFWQADVDEAAARLARLLEEERADVFATYDENGGYGHPDHVQVHRVALAGAQRAGTDRVFMATMNRDHMLSLADRSEELGVSMPEEQRAMLDTMGVRAQRITTAVDVRDCLDRKRRAMQAHASQITDTSFFLAMPAVAFEAVWGTEWYIRVGAPSGTGVEDSLLAPGAGVTAAPGADHNVPGIVAGEKETLLAFLGYLRASVDRKLDGVSDLDARRPLVASGTSLLGLVNHLVLVEVYWAQRRFAGADVVSHGDGFALDPTDTVASVRGQYAAACRRTDEIVAACPDLDRPLALGRHGLTVRWMLAHLLEETARHAGHADILRELVDGTTGR